MPNSGSRAAGHRYRRGTFPPPPKSVRIVRLAETESEKIPEAACQADRAELELQAKETHANGPVGFLGLSWRVLFAGFLVLLACLGVLWLT